MFCGVQKQQVYCRTKNINYKRMSYNNLYFLKCQNSLWSSVSKGHLIFVLYIFSLFFYLCFTLLFMIKTLKVMICYSYNLKVFNNTQEIVWIVWIWFRIFQKHICHLRKAVFFTGEKMQFKKKKLKEILLRNIDRKDQCPCILLGVMIFLNGIT